MNPEREPKKVFSYEEAASLLPEVRRLTEQAHGRVEALGATAQSGTQVQEEVGAVIAEWARSVLALGVEVKGLWLVDFDNGSGYYCWRFPETGLQFYHSYEEGFGGRM